MIINPLEKEWDVTQVHNLCVKVDKRLLLKIKCFSKTFTRKKATHIDTCEYARLMMHSVTLTP